jgi:hypothetical protein
MKVTVLLVVRIVIGDLDPSINVLPVGRQSGHPAERCGRLRSSPHTDASATLIVQRNGPISGSGF